MVFKVASSLNFKTRHFGTRLFWYLFGCLFNSTQSDIQTDGFQMASFPWNVEKMAPICVGSRLGSSNFHFPNRGQDPLFEPPVYRSLRLGMAFDQNSLGSGTACGLPGGQIANRGRAPSHSGFAALVAPFCVLLQDCLSDTLGGHEQ